MPPSGCTTLSTLTRKPTADLEELAINQLEGIRKNKNKRKAGAGSDELGEAARITVLAEEATPWSQLYEPLKEMILSKLPAVDFHRSLAVCKKWDSLTASSTFLAACREVDRRPWFLMISTRSTRDVAYDTDYHRWRHILFQGFNRVPGHRKLPVAASGGLVCIRSLAGDLAVWNPLTGSIRAIPALNTDDKPLLGIAMQTTRQPGGGGYKIVAAYGEAPSFCIKSFSSGEGRWSEAMTIRKWLKMPRRVNGERIVYDEEEKEVSGGNGAEEEVLDRRGCKIQISACKELSGVMARTEEGGEEVIHFFTPSGRMVAFSGRTATAHVYPEMLPPEKEHSIDIVACGGRMLAVVLLEMRETASLRVWEYADVEWRLVTSMPPAMSQELFRGQADVNCGAHDDLLMVCISSAWLYKVFICQLPPPRRHSSHDGFDDSRWSSWAELPPCMDRRSGVPKRFISACAFEPRIEAVP